nr:MAG TPA: hypothetical protein [Caudoviricetes sp.]
MYTPYTGGRLLWGLSPPLVLVLISYSYFPSH